MKAADLLYPALSLITSLYAMALDDNKQHAPPGQKIEPDGTLIEVIIGTGICLLGAAIRARLEPSDPDWRTGERIVWKAFGWGGVPIIVWQVWRALERQRRRGDTLQQYVERKHGDRERSTRAMAKIRWPGAEAN